MDERDIWRAASVLIERYGEDAELKAARRADDMEANGDEIGKGVWLRIKAAVREFSDLPPSGRPN